MEGRWMAAMFMQGSVYAQSQARFVLTTEQVAQALTEAGMTTLAAQVSLPARVVSLAPSPALDIVSIQQISKNSLTRASLDRAVVKLACHQPGECLPFYAMVAGMRPAALASGSNPSTSVTNTGRILRPDFTMPAGTHATLIMDDNRSHIKVAVVSLENGMAGH